MTKKKKVVRPRLKVKPKKVRMAYISDSDYAFFQAIGDNNFSKGLVQAKKMLTKEDDKAA
jgi:hypothetical protein